MEDNNDNESNEELSQEKNLEKANSDAKDLLNNLRLKKEEYANLLNEFKTKRDEIDSIVNELNKLKQDFIDDTNSKLIEYEAKFTDNNNSLDSQKTNIESILNSFKEHTDSIIEKYTKEASAKVEEINKKISESTDIINKEQEEFDEFILNSKTDYDKQLVEIKELASKYKSITTESIDNIATREKSIITSQAKIEKIGADLQVLKDSINEYIEKMSSKTKEIEETIEDFDNATDNIINKNKDLQKEIEQQLELATGEGLFYSFNKRKKDLEKNQWIWLGVLGLSIAILILFSSWMVSELGKIEWQGTDWITKILFKFLLPLPILYLVAFVTDRYTKERRLLEEYAFKSTISLALKPYFDMVVNKNITTEEREFLIKSIEKIFTTPTDKVYRTKECQNKIDISHLTEMTIAKAIKQYEEKMEEDKK